jgi:hypothetical protein
MTDTFKKFVDCDSGAVTVDFVALTGAIVFLGFIAGSTIEGGATELANNIQSQLANQAAGMP